MVELLHLAWELTEAFMFEQSETSAPSSNVTVFHEILNTGLPNRTDGSYTSSTPHIMSGPHQQRRHCRSSSNK
ncbi:hypothetical protein T06_13273 [Trichinella sp. T6]|nr:hypothetical protein T06_13273 [Trichinella sp. T6]